MQDELFTRSIFLPLFPPISGIPWQSIDCLQTNSKRRPGPFRLSTGSPPIPATIKSNVTGEPTSKTERERSRRFLRFVTQRLNAGSGETLFFLREAGARHRETHICIGVAAFRGWNRLDDGTKRLVVLQRQNALGFVAWMTGQWWSGLIVLDPTSFSVNWITSVKFWARSE